MPHPDESLSAAMSALQLASVAAEAPAPGQTFPHLQKGIWTPVDASGAGLVLTVGSATWVKHEQLVIARALVTWPATADASQAGIGGFPFPNDADQASRQGLVSWSNAASMLYMLMANSAAQAFIYAAPGGAACPNSTLSTKAMWFTVIYTTNP